MSSCDGTCCKRLWLIGSPGELYDRIMKVISVDPDSEQRRDEIWFWLQLRPLDIMLGVEWGPGNSMISHRYYCTRLDWKTGKCTVYEQRPYICREHAENGKPCEYVGCKHENALKFLEYKPGTATHKPKDVQQSFFNMPFRLIAFNDNWQVADTWDISSFAQINEPR